MMSLEDIRKKIDELKKISEPKPQLSMISCYDIAFPMPEDFEYVCPKCGEKTLYPKTPVNRIREVFESRRLIYALKNKIIINEFNTIWDYDKISNKYDEKYNQTNHKRYEEFIKPKNQDKKNPPFRDRFEDIFVSMENQNELKALDIELIESEFCAYCINKCIESPQLGLKINYVDKIVIRHPISFKDIEIIHEFIVGKLQISYSLGREHRSMHSHISRIEYLLGISEIKPEHERFNNLFVDFE